MSDPNNWTERVRDRIDDILGSDYAIGPDDVLTYRISFGYERLDVEHTDRAGGLHYAGAHHPGDGFCHAKADEIDASPGICVHCGKTLP